MNDMQALEDVNPSKGLKQYSIEYWAAKNDLGRCNAHSSRSGARCKRPKWAGAAVCGHHGARSPVVRQKARQRLEEASLSLAKELLRMAISDDVNDAVKLGAIKSALDRAGINERTSVEVDARLTISPFEEILSGIAPMSREESRARRGLPSGALAHASASNDLDALAAIDLTRMNQDANVIDAEVVSESPTHRRYFDTGKRSEPLQNNGIPEGYLDRDTAQEIVHRQRLAAGCYPEHRRRW
ncbi:hypothetical protein BH09ACT7_BH09ACT7_37520 [soil metagenome]